MFGILDRYIGRVIFMSILLCELTLVGLAALIKYVEQLKAVGEGNYDMLNALYYVLLSMPKEAVLFFPLAALLGGLIGLGPVSYTHLTLPTNNYWCRSRWSPYH